MYVTINWLPDMCASAENFCNSYPEKFSLQSNTAQDVFPLSDYHCFLSQASKTRCLILPKKVCSSSFGIGTRLKGLLHKLKQIVLYKNTAFRAMHCVEGAEQYDTAGIFATVMPFDLFQVS